jgi:hypothetical protein
MFSIARIWPNFKKYCQTSIHGWSRQPIRKKDVLKSWILYLACSQNWLRIIATLVRSKNWAKQALGRILFHLKRQGDLRLLLSGSRDDATNTSLTKQVLHVLCGPRPNLALFGPMTNPKKTSPMRIDNFLWKSGELPMWVRKKTKGS